LILLRGTSHEEVLHRQGTDFAQTWPEEQRSFSAYFFDRKPQLTHYLGTERKGNEFEYLKSAVLVVLEKLLVHPLGCDTSTGREPKQTTTTLKTHQPSQQAEPSQQAADNIAPHPTVSNSHPHPDSFIPNPFPPPPHREERPPTGS
jgi:hypothetical protein